MIHCQRCVCYPHTCIGGLIHLAIGSCDLESGRCKGVVLLMCEDVSEIGVSDIGVSQMLAR